MHKKCSVSFNDRLKSEIFCGNHENKRLCAQSQQNPLFLGITFHYKPQSKIPEAFVYLLLKNLRDRLK